MKADHCFVHDCFEDSVVRCFEVLKHVLEEVEDCYHDALCDNDLLDLLTYPDVCQKHHPTNHVLSE